MLKKYGRLGGPDLVDSSPPLDITLTKNIQTLLLLYYFKQFYLYSLHVINRLKSSTCCFVFLICKAVFPQIQNTKTKQLSTATQWQRDLKSSELLENFSYRNIYIPIGILKYYSRHVSLFLLVARSFSDCIIIIYFN